MVGTAAVKAPNGVQSSCNSGGSLYLRANPNTKMNELKNNIEFKAYAWA